MVWGPRGVASPVLCARAVLHWRKPLRRTHFSDRKLHVNVEKRGLTGFSVIPQLQNIVVTQDLFGVRNTTKTFQRKSFMNIFDSTNACNFCESLKLQRFPLTSQKSDVSPKRSETSVHHKSWMLVRVLFESTPRRTHKENSCTIAQVSKLWDRYLTATQIHRTNLNCNCMELAKVSQTLFFRISILTDLKNLV